MRTCTSSFLSAGNFLRSSYDQRFALDARGEGVHWRRQDTEWRERQREYAEQHLEHIAEKREWRKQDLRQAAVDNMGWLWGEFVWRTRAEVSLKGAQLKGMAFVSALLAGCAVTSFNQFNYPEDVAKCKTRATAVDWLFGVTTAIAFGLAMNAMVLASLLHASLVRVPGRYCAHEQEAEYVAKCFRWMESSGDEDQLPPLPGKTFDRFWKDRCVPAFRTVYLLFCTAVPAFLINLISALWIVFHPKAVRDCGDSPFSLIPPLASAAEHLGPSLVPAPDEQATPALNPADASVTTTTPDAPSTLPSPALALPPPPLPLDLPPLPPFDQAPHDYPPFIAAAASVVLAAAVVTFVILNWRWLSHVLGRSAMLQSKAVPPRRGLPFDWHRYAAEAQPHAANRPRTMLPLPLLAAMSHGVLQRAASAPAPAAAPATARAAEGQAQS